MENQKCKNCNYYSAYYKQWSDGYSRLTNGYCSKLDKPQKQSELCEDFKSNERKEEMRGKRRLIALEQALVSINEIAHILKEKENDKRIF